MKKFLLSMFLVAAATTAFSQAGHKCGTDEAYQDLISNDPSVLQRQQQFDLDAAEMATNNDDIRKTGEIRIIPVVFHIFHAAGSENISDAQINDEMRILNENFRYKNANAVNTRDIFKGVAGDMEIEFRLARKDPQGNCTNGIVRVYEEETDNGTNNIKLKSVWPTDRYLNVWVVDNIVNLTSLVGIAGFAQFPWAGSYNTDGVILRSDQIGSIGTSRPSNSTTVTHEVGHWLGCFHPFQDSCSGGDRVDDTPPCANRSGILSCDYTRNTCVPDNPNEVDLPDQIENYMDYITGTCQTMFTVGQKARMDASLANWRPLLTSQANLIATGTDQPNTPSNCKPIADFFSIDNQRSLSRFACEGGAAIDFRDNSHNFSGAVTREWIFEGGTPATSTGVNPNVTYNQPGKYDVTLIVSNANGSDTLKIDDYIEVIPTVSDKKAPYTQDFEFPAFPVDGWYTSSTTFTDFRITDVGNGTVLPNNSRTLQAPNGNGISGSRFNLFSPAIDLSGVSSPLVSFHYSFAQRFTGGSNTNDALRVFYSTNCGQTWIQMWVAVGGNLSTVGTTTPVTTLPFVPSDRSKWKQVNLNIPGSVTPAQRRNIRFRFQFASNGGNNFYIDAINFGFTSSVNNTFYADDANFNVYPNPTSGNANVSVNLLKDSKVKVTVQDILGRTITTLADGNYTQGNQEFKFDAAKHNTTNGIYFIKLTVNDNVYTKKLIQVK